MLFTNFLNKRSIIAAFTMALTLFSVLTTMAQQDKHLPPIGATWHFGRTSYLDHLAETPLVFEAVGDTTFKDKTFRIIEGDFDLITPALGYRVFLYGDYDQVYWYNSVLDSVLLVYDYGVDVGQTTEIVLDICYEGTPYENQWVEYYTPNIKKDTVINGITLTYMDNINPDFPTLPTRSIYSRIGAIYNIAPFYDPLVYNCVKSTGTPLYEFADLRCYEDPEIGLIQFEEKACDFDVATYRDFAPVGTKWHYSIEDMAGYFTGDYATVEVIKDTTINGQACRKLHLESPLNTWMESYFGKDFYIYDQDQVLYIYQPEDNNFVPLYVFPEDVIANSPPPALQSNNCSNNNPTRYNRKYHKDRFGHSLAYIADDSQMDTIFYGLGPLKGFIAHPLMEDLDCFDASNHNYRLGDLRCYERTDIGRIETGITPTCEYTVFNSQPYLTPDMAWTNSRIVPANGNQPDSLVNSTTYELDGSTDIIEGITYYQLYEGDQVVGYLREENNEIYFKENASSSEALLYNFNAHIDEELEIYSLDCGTKTCKVTDRSISTINGQDHFLWTLTYLDDNGQIDLSLDPFYWISGIGSPQGLFYSAECNSTDNSIPILCLFTKNNEAIYENSVFPGCNVDVVYPGDTNRDGMVNNWDVLPVGLAYNRTGPARPSSSSDWHGYMAADWQNFFADGTTNQKHADCDGNGLVESMDLNVISSNYRFQHTNLGKTEAAEEAVQISMSLDPDDYAPGDAVSLPITLGTLENPVDSIYGIAFTIEYDPMLVESGTLLIDFTESWMGTLGVDLMGFYYVDEENGQIDVAISRIDQQPTFGYGKIATSDFIMDDQILGKDIPTIRFAFKSILAIDELERVIEVIADNVEQSILADEEVFFDENVLVYPTNVQDKLVVESPTTIQSIEIYDVAGNRILQRSTMLRRVELDVNNLLMGVYYVRLETAYGVMMRQFVVMR